MLFDVQYTEETLARTIRIMFKNRIQGYLALIHTVDIVSPTDLLLLSE